MVGVQSVPACASSEQCNPQALEYGFIATMSSVPGNKVLLGAHYDGVRHGRMSGAFARPQGVRYSKVQDEFALVCQITLADGSVYALDVGAVYSPGPAEVIH